MKISELQVQDYLAREAGAEANSYIILNYGTSDSGTPITYRVSLAELSNMIINNHNLLRYSGTEGDKNLTSVKYASNDYDVTDSLGQFIDASDRTVLNSAVTDVGYDTTEKKITFSTRGGAAASVVTAATLKTDMALNNVNNTSDANKPISTATQTALDGKVPTTRKVNGHALSADVTITKGDVSLGNVDNTADADKPVSTAVQNALNLKMNSSARGAISGVASLDENGKVPASQLPSDVYAHAVTNKGIAKTSGLYKITTNSEGHITAATAVEKSDITALGIPGSDTTYVMDGTYNASTNKVATVSTVTNAINGLWTIPTLPAEDGTYNLQVTISSGTPTYSWVPVT